MITDGSEWQIYSPKTPATTDESIDLRGYETSLSPSAIQEIWDERHEPQVRQFGRSAIKSVVLNSHADSESGIVAFADGMTVPINSKAAMKEAAHLAASNREHQIYLLDEVYNLEPEVRQSIDPGLGTSQEADFGPYGRLYADYFESRGQFPRYLAGHSLGARAMIALAQDDRTEGQLTAMSTSEPSGSTRHRFPVMNLGLMRTTLLESAAIMTDKLKDSANDKEHFNDAAQLPLDYVKDVLERSNSGRETMQIVASLYRVARGLGRTGLSTEIERAHALHDKVEHYIWSGRNSFTVPHEDLVQTYYSLPESVRDQTQLAVSDTRHNSGIAFPAKFAAQTAYMIDQSPL